jgi:hypothetical protein
MGLPYFLGIYTALALTNLGRNISLPVWRKLMIIIVMGLTVPRVANEFLENIKVIPGRQEVMISAENRQMLSCLSRLEDGVLLLPPEWSRLETSLHIRYLTDKKLHLAALKGVLEDHGITEASERYEEVRQLFFNRNQNELLNYATLNQVDYLYAPKDESGKIMLVGGFKLCETENYEVLDLR